MAQVNSSAMPQSLVHLFLERVQKSSSAPAQLVKRGGQWQTISWVEQDRVTREVAHALLRLGLEEGDRVAILSGTRPEWVHADIAVLANHAISVPIYPTSPADQIQYILENCGARMVFVETLDHFKKLQGVWDSLPDLQLVLAIDPSIPADKTMPEEKRRVWAWEDLVEYGRNAVPAERDQLIERTASIGTDDEATYVYTSGTTGPPKGVIQTHRNHLHTVTALDQIGLIKEGEICLLFLPLAHSFARAVEYMMMRAGCITAFAESIEKVRDNLQEVHPHFLPSVPRIFEKVYQGIQSQAAAGSPVKKKIFAWAIGVGKQVSKLQQERKPIPFGLELQRKVAHKLVFSKIQAKLGGRISYFISGGAALSREIAEFFHAVGLLVLEGYGLTETTPALSINRPDAYKFGTVGKILPGVEVKIAPDGEILAKGPNVVYPKGYYKRPEANAEVFDDEGWFHTGDIGEFDSEGFLRITDRKKDLIKTSGGKYVAPQNVENALKTSGFVSQAMVHGDNRKFCSALITLNQENVEKWAQEKGLKHSDWPSLATSPEVHAEMKKIVDERNQQFGSWEQIKKFQIVPQDFSQESGELTPTLKVKRKVVTEKYRDVLDAFYKE
jgi:long-chain acyl-CoA synthetase